MRYKFKGKVIVFEGIDGCGKDTQLDLFSKRIKKEFSDVKVSLTREPWDNPQSPDSMRIRRILKHEECEIDPGDGRIISEKLQTMYVADRYIHWVKAILPEIDKGNLVISNRERLSTLAYGLAFNVSIDEILDWHRLLPEPDLTINLKISAKSAIERLNIRSTHLEIFEKEESLEKISQAYDFILANNYLRNTITIDGERKVMEIHEDIWAKVLVRFETKKS